MKMILSTALTLLVGCEILHGARVPVPIYFVPGDSATSGCTAPGWQGFIRVSSSRLQLGFNGQMVDFLGAKSDTSCKMEGAENRLSIFTGRDPSKWRSHIPIARRIRFQSIYPGIDIVYYGNGSQLEYDLEVAAGAAVSRIQLGFADNAALKISSAGDLMVSVGDSTLIQHRPRVRQGDREIPAHYAIEANGKTARIRLGAYDHSRP
jgi:hypothetical protein